MNFTKALKRIEHWNLRKLTRYFVVLGLIIGIVTAYVSYNRLYLTPERRFWMAIDNSMATPSVVRTLRQGGSGNEVVQNYRFHHAPQSVIENTVDFIERSPTTDTQIATEGILTSADQYLRYTAFSSADGTNLDELLGKWAKQEVLEGQEEDARLAYVSEYVSLAIFGNYDARYRNQVVSSLQDQNVYVGNLTSPLEDTIDGQDAYIYQVTVQLKPYATALSDAFRRAGLGEFPPLNPENYAEDSTVGATIAVSKKDNSIIRITFGGREEIYSNYGVQKQVAIPEADRTVVELQQQVQQTIGQ